MYRSVKFPPSREFADCGTLSGLHPDWEVESTCVPGAELRALGEIPKGSVALD